jgi:hypothetical protein
MATGWSTKRVLIVVRTYPVPAQRGIEVSCTAGITDTSEWIRLYPVPYRFLTPDKRFAKYQWIEVEVTRPRNDQRPESYSPRLDTIHIGATVSPDDGWRARKDIVFPLRRNSLCQIADNRKNLGGPTLGIFKPGRIGRLAITPSKTPKWTPQEEARLRQQLLGFERTPKTPLEKIPLEFRYEFRCAEASCIGHRIMCTDWEMGQSYRRWRDQYGDRWEAMFRQRYECEMIDKNETHFYVGNLHGHQDTWLIVGLFYPPKLAIGDLFDIA